MNRVVLVGAGCGSGMLTLRGAALLQACDCVVYDSLLDESILGMVKPSCRKIFAGKRAGRHSLPQEEINALLLSCAGRYPLTVRLKGGDPCVFGRGGEEAAALAAAGVACEFVPGVTSAVAAAEFAGIPVTHRGVSRGLHVITAHTAEGTPAFSQLAREQDTLVFLMAKAAAGEIAEGLMRGGMSGDMPAALISAAGMPAMQVRRCLLRALAQTAADMPAPLTAIVGMVCAPDLLSPPRSGVHIAVTGTPEHVRRVCAALRARGVSSVACAHLAIVPRPFDGVYGSLGRYRMLVFTSANGVQVFFERARELGVDWRVFGDKRFAVIGPQTAERLRQYGFYADVMPQEYTVAALTDVVVACGLPAERVALLRAAEGSDELLRAGEQIALYETVADGGRIAEAAAQIGRANYVTFGSAGGARALLSVVRLPEGATPVCIGSETAKELRRQGYTPLVAANATAAALAAAIEEDICRD